MYGTEGTEEVGRGDSQANSREELFGLGALSQSCGSVRMIPHLHFHTAPESFTQLQNILEYLDGPDSFTVSFVSLGTYGRNTLGP